MIEPILLANKNWYLEYKQGNRSYELELMLDDNSVPDSIEISCYGSDAFELLYQELIQLEVDGNEIVGYDGCLVFDSWMAKLIRSSGYSVSDDLID